MNKIEWTERVWNPVTGCTKVSAGCKNCYAEVFAKRFWKGRKFTDIQYHEDRLIEPLRRKKPTMYFVNSMSDLFHEQISFDIIVKILDVMRQARQHIFQVLTKRPERMCEVLDLYNRVLPNVWLGISVENQATANVRLEPFRLCKARIKFVSYEPALSFVNWQGYEFINWIIAGGESGAKRRPNDLQWFRYTRDWARANNIAFFMKQIDKKQNIPDDLFIREYPIIKKKRRKITWKQSITQQKPQNKYLMISLTNN